ncbi:unnamed protein product [Taenia asiatica]|uniref:Secreted protein n=1 Tax=Taenia asiatica TaxID=60517 RepID=A0A0R3VZB2_TAEAS|nr:unnamed protein product [Taenia asiatica]
MIVVVIMLAAAIVTEVDGVKFEVPVMYADSVIEWSCPEAFAVAHLPYAPPHHFSLTLAFGHLNESKFSKLGLVIFTPHLNSRFVRAESEYELLTHAYVGIPPLPAAGQV